MSCELVQFVMVEPSHAGNVGAAARAIKTMGFEQLVLVAPKDLAVCQSSEAIALASGADDILGATKVCDTLEAALFDSTYVVAMSARPRELSPKILEAREQAQTIAQHVQAQSNAKISLVFGTERTGLTNAQVQQCDSLSYIATTSEYSSLNVAQAIQLMAYELRFAMTAKKQQLFEKSLEKYQAKEPLASHQAVQQLLEHWEQALLAIGFLDPQHPKRLLPRFQRLWRRAELQAEEVDMLRGVCKAMIRTAEKKQQ